MLRGEGEGDRLVKETAAAWRNELREVDSWRGWTASSSR